MVESLHPKVLAALEAVGANPEGVTAADVLKATGDRIPTTVRALDVLDKAGYISQTGTNENGLTLYKLKKEDNI